MHACILIISITLVQSPIIIEMEGGCLKQLVYAFMLLLLPLPLSLEFNNSNGNTRCIERERQALLAFKQGFTGGSDSEVLSSWGGRDCCRWRGVYCDNQTRHVTRLHPGDQVLTGAISPKLIELQHLEYLVLGFIGSQIPNFIGSLTNLRYLDLYLPEFSGKFPYQLGNLTHLQYLTVMGFGTVENLNWLPYLSSLKYLDLSRNNLSNIFDWLETVNKLPNLRNLTLIECDLPPPIFSTLSHVNSSKYLAHVDLSENPDATATTSSMSKWLCNCNSSLVYLDLANTNLIGPIPDASGNINWLPYLSSLRHLDLSTNDLGNAFDWLEIVNKLPNLRDLTLAVCSLPPPIFSTLPRINSSKYLAHVDLGYNPDATATTSSMFKWLCNYNSSLVYLDLGDTSLIGPIPDVFGNMSSLAFLDLSSNNLEGGIPFSSSKLCSLQSLDLVENNLSGRYSDIVQTLSKCAQNSLEILRLGWNDHIAGSLPNRTNFPSLRELFLSRTGLTGRVPESIWQMSKLETLNLGSTYLEGAISETHFSKLSRLFDLNLSNNKGLVLNLSSDWVPPFQLEFMLLRHCKMGPSFPQWLQTQKEVKLIDISDAGISDILPSWFWDWSHVARNTDISSNQIRGTLENLRFEFEDYPRYNLSWNLLEGPILPTMLSKATSVDLSTNKFSGSTSFLCHAKVGDLQFLDLSSNNLSGKLPDCWTHFQNLIFLDLSDNAFSGKLPTTMGNLFSIESLKLDDNKFVGEFPSLKNCKNLTVIDLSNNKLSGPIPKWLGVGFPHLAILVLRSNLFNGSMPSQLCHLTSIQVLDLSMNNISGSIPKCLNNLSALAQEGPTDPTISHLYESKSGPSGSWWWGYEDEIVIMWKGRLFNYKSTLGLVKSIDFSSNKLTGEIPSEITHLVGLVSLNLSRNHLTGQITSKIGKLKSLNSLDLSRNRLNGTIPTSVFQIYSLGVLDLSNNDLSGKIPTGTQLQSYDASYFAGNPQLCGFPLERKCSLDLKNSSQQLENFGNQEDDGITKGFYISIGLGFFVGFWGVCGSLIFNRSWRYTYFKFLNLFNDRLYVLITLIWRQLKNRLS